MCDTIRSICSIRWRDTTTFGRLVGRCRRLDHQPGDRIWAARLSRRAQHGPLGVCHRYGGADRDRSITLAGRLPSIGRLVELCLSLLAAYVAYEVVLFAFTPVLGGAGAFTVALIVRIGLLNVLSMIGLVAAYELLKVPVLKHQQFVA